MVLRVISLNVWKLWPEVYMLANFRNIGTEVLSRQQEIGRRTGALGNGLEQSRLGKLLAMRVYMQKSGQRAG